MPSGGPHPPNQYRFRIGHDGTKTRRSSAAPQRGGGTRSTRLAWFILATVLLLPAIASAQASIAGAVHDTSGAVLPGVTVEASSPALIERVRSVVTDGSGQYKIVDLRPGTYAVVFTLT